MLPLENKVHHERIHPALAIFSFLPYLPSGKWLRAIWSVPNSVQAKISLHLVYYLLHMHFELYVKQQIQCCLNSMRGELKTPNPHREEGRVIMLGDAVSMYRVLALMLCYQACSPHAWGCCICAGSVGLSLSQMLSWSCFSQDNMWGNVWVQCHSERLHVMKRVF